MAPATGSDTSCVSPPRQRAWRPWSEASQGYVPTRWYANARLDRIPANEDGRRGVYETDICAAQACDFIRAHRDRPFFFTLAYNALHSPYVVPAFGAMRASPGERGSASMLR